MKKLLTISLCAALVLGLTACGAATPDSSAPSISVVPPVPESSESSNTEQEPQLPPIPADAAMYRGTVTAVAAPDADKKVLVTLEQYEGTDFGASSLKFAFTADTRADFTPEQGQYLEVYYGMAPQQPLDTATVHDIITAIQYHSADMVNYNGYVVSIETHPDKPNQGWIMMSATPPSENGMTETPIIVDGKPVDGSGQSSSASDSPVVHMPAGNEIRFNYDKDKTKFYLNFDEIKVGDRLNIFQSGAMTMSLPPQSFAIEVRPYANASAK